LSDELKGMWKEVGRDVRMLRRIRTQYLLNMRQEANYCATSSHYAVVLVACGDKSRLRLVC